MEDREKSFASQVLTAFVLIIFLVYLVLLVKVTLIKGTSIPRLAQNLLEGRTPLQALNLVPLRTILGYLQYRQEMNFLRWFSNIFGNLLIFVPLGLYLPLLLQRMRRFPTALLAVIVLSISLETLQYVLGTGSADIDDFWLNTAGGIVGYGLFRIVARPEIRRVTALSLTLVLSFFFAVAGYLIAYREFGIYLGLAKLSEEVRGGEQIPSRPPDAVGTVSQVRGDSIILATLVRALSMTVPLKAEVESLEGFREIEVQISPSTRFYDKETSLEVHKLITRYSPYTASTPANVPKEAFASVWGRWEEGRLLAEVVCTTRPPRIRGMVSIKTVRQAPGGGMLPANRPDLLGHFKGFIGNNVLVHKILVSEQGGSMLAVFTKMEDRFRLTAKTAFYKKRILRGGREVSVASGKREDMVPRAMLEVWGRMQDGVLEADIVCINVFK